MRRTAAFLMALAAIAVANPVVTIFWSEFQTAPDSLERIELHPYSSLGSYPFDLGGTTIATNAGVAVIDSGVRFENESSYVVIDRSNTTGIFTLDNDTDLVQMHIPGSPETLRLSYPGDCWAPSSGQSCALFQWWEYVPPGDWEDFYAWYVDETPTFRQRNDDTLGGITGYVYEDHGGPLDGATVRVTSSQGAVAVASCGHWWTWPHGYFAQTPIGPGIFFVTATKPGYLPGCYPDSIRLNTNERRDGINIYLYPLGLAEQAVASGRVCPCISYYRNRLLVISDRAGPTRVTMVNQAGRVVWSRTFELRTGVNRVAFDERPAPGVYFATCKVGQRALKAKLVLY